MVKEKEEKQKPAKAVSQAKKEGKINPRKISTRGRVFEGIVVRKFPKKITIEFERTVFIRKYERYMKKKTRIHARLPDESEDKVKIGDFVKVRECRPLSKTIHFIFIEKSLKEKEQGK